MFTGIVEEAGVVARVVEAPGSIRLQVRGKVCGEGTHVGDSIAVNGCCLTAVEMNEGDQLLTFDLLRETWTRTNLSAVREGSLVNLERAMRPTDRLGGHLVSGHVDGVGRVLSVHEDARAERWRFAAPAPLLKYIAKKGSICVDGVSLTVNEVDGEGFEVALIPHTVSHTAFSQTAVGDAVNLEIDLVARYVERLLGAR